MKFTMSGFNQKKLIEFGLDLKDAALLRYFIDFKDTNSMSMIIVDNKPYYWVKYEHLKNDLPILGINNNDALRRRLKKLESAGILGHYHKLEEGSYSYYCVGDNYKNLLVSDDEIVDFNNYTPPTQKSHPSDSKVAPLRPESRTPPTEKSEQNNPSTKDKSTKDNNKKEKKKKTEFDVEIENYTSSENLREALYEFIKARKAIKAQMTTMALKKLLNRLDSLATDDNKKIEILNISIMNGWKGIFPLNQNKNPTFDKNIKDTRGFNNFKPREYDYDALEKKLLGW